MLETSDLSREFLHACQAGDVSRVETLTTKCNVKDWTDFRHTTSGDTPLHVATREGHLDVVRFLCEAFEKPEFKVDVTNKDMKRPLHEAAQFARSNVLRYLIEKGASVDSLKRADWTPLMLACTKTGDKACECINELLKAGANIFLRNKDGWTPFLIVCRSGDLQACNLLLNHTAKCVDDRSNNGRSAMHIAAFHGHLRIIELLAKASADLVIACDSSGSTPLHEAIKGGHLNAAKEILRLGGDVNATDKVGQTILHIAAITGNVLAVEYILQRNLIDVHVEAFFGVTPLVAARRSKQTDVVDYLIKNGATR